MQLEQGSGENVTSAAISPTDECVCDGPDMTIMAVFMLLQEAKEACDEEGSIGLCNDACTKRQLAQCEMTEQKTTVGLKSRQHMCIQDKPLLRRIVSPQQASAQNS